jgi:Ran GTPase-activating protein (RanGAP) involved in mRNA processing and transport
LANADLDMALLIDPNNTTYAALDPVAVSPAGKVSREEIGMPEDCWAVVITFLKSSKDFFELIYTTRTMYDLVEWHINAWCVENVDFYVINELPDKGCRKYVRNVIVNDNSILWCLSRSPDNIGHLPNLRYLTTINLSLRLSRLPTSLNIKITEEITKALKVNKTLEVLNLSQNNLGESDMTYIADALETNTSIKSIVLSGNDADDAGFEAIAKALKVNNTLTTVNLSDNPIGYDGAKAIAKALKVNNTLTTIDLSANMIGDKGAGVIAEGIKVNKTLTYIDLSYNRIGDDGAKAIAEAIKVNKTLTSINLFANEIGNDGAKAIAEAIKINKTLTSIYIGHNSNIGVDGARAIAEAIEEAGSILTQKNYLAENLSV